VGATVVAASNADRKVPLAKNADEQKNDQNQDDDANADVHGLLTPMVRALTYPAP
jgi:hypothetical protein